MAAPQVCLLHSPQGIGKARDTSSEQGKRSHHPPLKKRGRLDGLGAYVYVVPTVGPRSNAANARVELLQDGELFELHLLGGVLISSALPNHELVFEA
jgi:hypothetical protein